MSPAKSITLLWALRSHCGSHGCTYCYFGTIADHREAGLPLAPGALSHLSPNDLTADHVLAFARTLKHSAVKRVFLAGGESLHWRPVFQLIAVLKAAGIQVVVCTSGAPLQRPEIAQALVDLGVDAVSVSLDSADPVHNDTYRPPRRDGDGWTGVLAGIRALLDARGEREFPKVGIYSVITRRNLNDVSAVPKLAADFGCDYAVPQPISLTPDHKLHATLALRPEDTAALHAAFSELYGSGLALHLPPATYPDQVVSTVLAPTSAVAGCFGGHTLYFVEPDGSVWDCPSMLKMAATQPTRRRSIRSADAADLFGPPTGCPADCALQSSDCVNMWPLMAFDSTLTTTTGRRPA